jgi:hypothetical protein
MSVAETKEFLALLDDILDECEDDHVGLWSVVKEVRNVMGRAHSARRKAVTLELLRFLLTRHLIEAGFPTPDGKGFDPWTLSPDETIDKIAKEWGKLGRDPSGGEIVWFTAPNSAPKRSLGSSTRRSRP